MEERLTDVVPTLIAYREPAVTSQPGQRAFHHPPVPSQPLARVYPASGHANLCVPLPRGLAAASEVVGLVGVQFLRSLDRLQGVYRLLQDLRVVDVGGREHYRERDASSVRNNVALGARYSFIRPQGMPLFKTKTIGQFGSVG